MALELYLMRLCARELSVLPSFLVSSEKHTFRALIFVETEEIHVVCVHERPVDQTSAIMSDVFHISNLPSNQSGLGFELRG